MTGPPRVLFLTESYHPVLGGGETHIRALAGRLARLGWTATVLTRRSEPSWPAEERLDGVRVRRVPPSGPGRTGKYAMVPAALAALGGEAAGHDLVVVRGTRVLGLPAVVAARALGLRVVLQAEVNGEMSGEVYAWGTALEAPLPRRLLSAAVAVRNGLLRDADAFVAVSTRIRDEFLEAGVPREKVALIPHGVDTERFRPPTAAEREALRGRLGLPAGAELVVYTGRLLRGKGLEVLVTAFGRVAASRPRVHLVLVGSGAGQALSVEADLREKVERDGLAARTTFAGRVENVEDYLRGADVFAFPSVFEALGLSLIEAAACGLPAVGSRTGGIVDVIEHEGSGLLVAPGDAGELAAGLSSLLAEPERRAALGRRAREIARTRFDLDESVDLYRGLFTEVCLRSP